MSTETVLQTASILLLPPPSDLIHEEKPPCPGLLTHSLGRPCTSAATTGTDAKTKLPPTTHEIDARVRVIVDVPTHLHLHPHPPLPPITTRRSENCCVDTRRVHELERGSATLYLRERDRVLEDTQAPEHTHPHAISDSTSDSESPSVMRAEKQGVGGSGAANAGAQTQSHGDDEQGLGERAEGGEDIDIDDDGASDSQPPPHHA